MKKLLIALAAVATGFFASTAVADEEALPTGVGFDSLEAETDLDISGDAHWTPSANVSEMKVKAWGAQEFPEGIMRPAVPSGEDQANYLSVKTAFGNPLIRKALAEGAPEVKDGKIFFDSMVKFTATDEDPDTNYDNAKLIVYVKDNSEAEVNPSATTNLYVVAGDEKTTYDLGGINVDVWHRLTIKAVKAYAQGDELAFTVYVDQQPKAATEAAFDDTTGLNTEAKGINAAKRLFPSISACTSITEVGFDGQGCIDDLVFDNTVEGEWVKENAFAITKGENIESYKWTVKSGGVEVDSATVTGDASIPAVKNMTVEISDVVFAAGSWKLAAETDGCDFEDGVFTGFGDGSTSAKLIAEDTTPRVAVTIDEAPAVTYPSLAKAFEAINALEPGNVVVKFDRNYFTDGKVKVGTYLVGDVPYNEAVIGSSADVTLDLAGCTIEGPDGYEGPALAFQSNVTIVDTVGGGKVVPVEDNTAAVMYLANLAIAGGTFDGAFVTGDDVVMPAGTITAITGGSFDYATSTDENGKFKFELTADYVAKKDNESEPKYWVVSPAPKAGVEVTETHAVVTGVKSGDQLAAGAKISFTVEADTNYTLTSVKIGDEEQGTGGSYEYEVTADDVAAKTLNITAVATATEWTIMYYNDDDLLYPSVFAEEKYSVEEGTLNSGAKEGYTFNGWSDEEGNPVETLEGKTGDLELFGSWTKDQVFDGGSGVELDPYQIASTNALFELQEKVAAGSKFEGVYFKQMVTIDFTGAPLWKGIGSKDGKQYFGGIYDGNNKRIDNVTFDAQGSESNSYMGFFRYVKNGTIKDLTIESDGFDNVPEVFGETTEYGGAVIAGYAVNATLSGLTAEGQIGTQDDPTTHNAGGIVVCAIASTVENCVSKANLYCAYSKASGIVVFANPSKDYDYGSVISNCRNEGTIIGIQCWTNTNEKVRCESTDAGAAKFKGVASDGYAGILAWVGDSTRAVALTNNVNTGSITADGGYIGGIIGKISNPVIGEGNSCAEALPIVGTFFAAQGTDFWYESIAEGTATQDTAALAAGQTRFIAAGSGNSADNLPKPVLALATGEDITFITNLCATALNFSGITASTQGDEIKEEGVAGGVKFTAAAPAPQDWPAADDPAIIGKSAKTIFGDKVPETLKDVPASKFTAWAKKAGVDFATCKAADISLDAYLLDCAAANVEEEAKKFKITSIVYQNGEWVVTVAGDVTDGENYNANAKVEIVDVTTTLDSEATGATDAKGFYKATLVPDTTPDNN